MRVALLYHLSFKVNRFLWWGTWATTVLSFNAGKGLSRSVWMLSATEVQPSSPSVSFICPCVTVQPQCASPFLWEESLGFQHVGEDFCLAPHLSFAYLNHAHSCHPSHCPPISLSLSLCCQMQQNIVLSFSSTLLHFVFQTKAHFSVCHPDDDWQLRHLLS